MYNFYLLQTIKIMRLGRYHEAPNSMNFLQNNNKLTSRKLAYSATKNPQLTNDTMKLPALSNSMMMRSSANFLGNERNTKNKLNNISHKLDELQSQLHNARMDANESFNQIKFLKQELVENQLTKDNEDLKGQVAGLAKLVKITKVSHEQRSNDLREDYIQLWNQTQEMRQLVFQLRMRMGKIQETMGMNNV